MGTRNTSYKDKVRTIYHNAWCMQSRQLEAVGDEETWVVMKGYTPGDTDDRLSTGTSPYDAWKNAWLAIRCRQVARTIPIFTKLSSTKALSVRVPPELKQAVERGALSHGLTLNEYVVQALTRYVDA